MNRSDISKSERSELAKQLIEKEAKKLADLKSQKMVEKYVDKVQLGVDGWKMRYYTNKFLVTDPSDVKEFT